MSLRLFQNKCDNDIWYSGLNFQQSRCFPALPAPPSSDKVCDYCFSIDRWLVPPKPKPPPASIFGKLSALKPYQLSLPYLKNNYVYLSFLTFFLLVNVSLFVTRSFQYRKSSIFVIIARACGMLSSCFCNLIDSYYPTTQPWSKTLPWKLFYQPT